MRIISGKYKGRRIQPPKNLPVRPTTDMSKEALFNVLNNHFNFEGLKVLDLFSGTGNISYEFASRGSYPITSVDGDFGCVKFIKQVAAEYDFTIAATKSDVFKFLENYGFNIVSLDEENLTEGTLNSIKNNFKKETYTTILVLDNNYTENIKTIVNDYKAKTIDVKSMINVETDNTDDYLTVMQDFIDNIENICIS